jgi:hypothetical protein
MRSFFNVLMRALIGCDGNEGIIIKYSSNIIYNISEYTVNYN